MAGFCQFPELSRELAGQNARFLSFRQFRIQKVDHNRCLFERISKDESFLLRVARFCENRRQRHRARTLRVGIVWFTFSPNPIHSEFSARKSAAQKPEATPGIPNPVQKTQSVESHIDGACHASQIARAGASKSSLSGQPGCT
jgi:hypothetical protein